MAEKTFDDPSDPGADGAADANTLIKKRARRRLVGAIALALFAVIALPVVMDREPPPAGPEIQIRIPSQEARTGESEAGAKAGAPKVTAPSAARPEPIASNESKSESVAPAEVPATKPAAPEPQSAGSAPVAPPPTATKSARDDRAKAEAALAGAPTEKAAEKSTPATGDKWIVQLGAYQNAGNVAVLMGKLKEMKIPAYTEKFTSPQGPRVRVRAGPFASREAATRAAERIKILGVNGPVAPASADKS